jgi:TrmH family RNA methyltransferase
VSLNFKSISSKDNEKLKAIRQLKVNKAREQSGLFLLESEQLINEALSRKQPLKTLVVNEDYLPQFHNSALAGLVASQNIELLSVNSRLMEDLSTLAGETKVVASASIPNHDLEKILNRETVCLMALEEIQDPGNLGTIIRSAIAFGIDAIILSGGCVDPFSPKVVRSAMGALFSLPIFTNLNFQEFLPELTSRNFAGFSFTMNGKEKLAQKSYPNKVVLIFGNEGRGLSPHTLELSTATISIPMEEKGIESLNLSVAASIAMYDYFSKRSRGS